MSLLPSFALDAIEDTDAVEESVSEIPREYGIDFETGLLTGTIVEGLEAIRVWIWLALNTERYRYPIYSWQHGSELEQYIGRGYSQDYLDADMFESVEECLMQNEHILSVSDFSVDLKGDCLIKSFHVNTDIGGMDINV